MYSILKQWFVQKVLAYINQEYICLAYIYEEFNKTSFLIGNKWIRIVLISQGNKAGTIVISSACWVYTVENNLGVVSWLSYTRYLILQYMLLYEFNWSIRM